MTVKAMVTFTMEINVTVVGKSLKEIRRAAEKEAAGGLKDWGVNDDWDVHVAEIRPDTVLTKEQLEALPCHVGVVGGELLHIYDYNQKHGTNIKEAD